MATSFPLDKRRSEEQQQLVEQAFDSLGTGVLQEINARVQLESYVEECLRKHYAERAAAARALRINAVSQVLQELSPEHLVSFVQSINSEA